ncbi:MAG TPA: ABC transporter permease [Candidatus Acidoferrum sp.]|jgi:predicted permease
MSATHDLRYALRLLTRSRLSTALAILSLALGIGATTAIFSVVYAVLVDPYPYTAADRIGGFHLFDKKNQEHYVGYTLSEYIEIKSAAKSIESAIVTGRHNVTLTEHGLPEAVVQEVASPNAFEFFGVPPLFGRTFSTKDTGDESKVENVAVLSYLFWQRHFLSRRDILGQSVRLNDNFYTIIGVLPPRFTWEEADIYTPLAIHPAKDERYNVVYRAKLGIPKEQLNSEFQSFHEKFAKSAPSFAFPDPPFRTRFESVNESILGKFANTLMALLGAVVFLLLIACANVANLLLARASARRGEIAVRAALGAGGRRIAQQLLTESTLLSLTGGALGVLVAYAGVKAVVALLPQYSIPAEAVIAINIPVLCFAVVVSVLTGILFGMAPAFQLARQNQSAFLKDAGRSSGAGSATNRLRNVLIVAEVALSLVLLTGAALAASGLISLSRQKLGYDPNGVLTVFVPAPADRYPQWSQRRTFFGDINDRLVKIPTVLSVASGVTGVPPYTGANLKIDMPGLKEPARVRVNLVSENYLTAMRIPLQKGRFLDGDDIFRPNAAAVVSEDFVKTYFTNNEDPIGRHISIDVPLEGLPPGFVKPPTPPASYEIVGVAAPARNAGLHDNPQPMVYVPFTELLPDGMMFAIRTTNPNPATITNEVRAAVSAVDPTQPLGFVYPLDYYLGRDKAYPRFATFLFGVFGVLGLALASIGIFGVVAYSVSRRTREFGIRMALGATSGNVLRLVVSAMARVLIIGFVLGTILSFVSTRLLANKLQGLGDSNPAVIAIVIAVLAIAALTACILPARSATQIHPSEALRHE